MKKLIFTHLFLNLYLLALVQPVLPVIEYLMNYDYIVAELCKNRDKPILACNGKCYLEKQVTQQLFLDRNAEIPNPPIVDLEKFITISPEMFVYPLFGVIIKRGNLLFLDSLKDNTFILSLFKPPRV